MIIKYSEIFYTRSGFEINTRKIGNQLSFNPYIRGLIVGRMLQIFIGLEARAYNDTQIFGDSFDVDFSDLDELLSSKPRKEFAFSVVNDLIELFSQHEEKCSVLFKLCTYAKYHINYLLSVSE